MLHTLLDIVKRLALSFAIAFLLLLFSVVVVECSADGAPSLTKGRTVRIDGPIVDDTLDRIAQPILILARDGSRKPVDIVVDSPGGSIEAGFLFINVLEAARATGTPIRCFVPNMAASMAFQILLHCDERYALRGSWLLWHGARLYMGRVPLTSELALQLGADLGMINTVILRDLDRVLGAYLSPAAIRYHFRVETFHSGEGLSLVAPGFLRAYDHIPGLLEALKDPKVPSSNPGGDIQMRIRPGTIVYIRGQK